MMDSGTRIKLDEVQFVEVDLQPRVELGADSGTPLSGRLSLGEPVMFAITSDLIADDDDALREYLRAEAASSTYFLLDLVVNLRSQDDESFGELGVGVRLSCVEPAPSQPIAWSLAPMRSSTPIPVRRTVSLTVKSGLIEPKIEHQSEQAHQDDFVVAFGKRESSFEWRYRGSPSHPLGGTHQMQAVIKGSAGVDVQANIVVSATVRVPRLGLSTRRYRAALPTLLHIVHGSAPSSPAINNGSQADFP